MKSTTREYILPTVTVEEAQGHLKEIITGLNPGEAMFLVQEGDPVATLSRTPPKPWPSKAGSYRKAEFGMAPDFDASLELNPKEDSP